MKTDGPELKQNKMINYVKLNLKWESIRKRK